MIGEILVNLVSEIMWVAVEARLDTAHEGGEDEPRKTAPVPIATGPVSRIRLEPFDDWGYFARDGKLPPPFEAEIWEANPVPRADQRGWAGWVVSPGHPYKGMFLTLVPRQPQRSAVATLRVQRDAAMDLGSRVYEGAAKAPGLECDWL